MYIIHHTCTPQKSQIGFAGSIIAVWIICHLRNRYRREPKVLNARYTLFCIASPLFSFSFLFVVSGLPHTPHIRDTNGTFRSECDYRIDIMIAFIMHIRTCISTGYILPHDFPSFVSFFLRRFWYLGLLHVHVQTVGIYRSERLNTVLDYVSVRDARISFCCNSYRISVAVRTPNVFHLLTY